jgi:hypothetical protein
MKELNQKIFTPLLLFVFIIVIASFLFSDGQWDKYSDYDSIGTLLSPNVIDYTQQTPSNCPKCTPCVCPICPTMEDTMNNRDYRVIGDPLYPPEQRSDYSTNLQQYNGYFRYPTRGYPPPYQKKGYLVDQSDSKNIISIFGRPKYVGSTEYQYYVSKNDLNNNDIKIPISNNREIFDGDIITIQNDIFKGTYKFVGLPMEDLVQRPIY